jgi:dipeptidyl aminopeptidase/acylaminoacyl peptidase
MPRTSPFGTWASPVTLDRLVEDTVGLSFPIATARYVYWTEARPAEAGRNVLVRRPVEAAARGREEDDERANAPEEVTPAGFSARSRVHEYGGLCAAVRSVASGGDVVCFSNFSDQRVYKVTPGEAPVPLTPTPPLPCAWRYAAPVFTPDGGHLLAVRERHGDPDVPSTVVNDVVIVDTDGADAPRSVLSGHDFYSHLALSPDGQRLCWVSWDHPSMPWDGTELWEGELDVERARVLDARRVAGGPGESVTQPKYAPDGTLHYVSDRTGWWNLYAAGRDGGPDRACAPMEAELGVPDFVVGISSYALLRDGTVLATWRQSGLSYIGVLPPGASTFDQLDTGFSYVAELRGADDGSSAVAVVGSGALPPSVVRIVPGEQRGSRPVIEVLRRSRDDVVDTAYLSTAEPVDVPTEGGEVVHALYYAPTNGDFRAPEGELPPLIVNVHGGPTSAAVPVLNYSIQFWTSRGFAFVDVNYGGSSGYGRAYRERLRGRWGIVDLDDCVAAARHLVATGRADGRRLLIHGGSAGGYTALCAAAFTDAFAAAASYYGIADLVALAAKTHKFESHYTDSLLGRWPEAAEVYRARSPARHGEALRTPLILFQGLEDPIVPPEQAEMMLAALRGNGVPHAYVAYEGEQHGFCRAEHVRRTAEAELYFYARVLGLSPADELVPVEIVHEDRIAPLSST